MLAASPLAEVLTILPIVDPLRIKVFVILTSAADSCSSVPESASSSDYPMYSDCLLKARDCPSSTLRRSLFDRSFSVEAWPSGRVLQHRLGTISMMSGLNTCTYCVDGRVQAVRGLQCR